MRRILLLGPAILLLLAWNLIDPGSLNRAGFSAWSGRLLSVGPVHAAASASRPSIVVPAHRSSMERERAIAQADSAPVFMGYRIVRPAAFVADGDWVEFFTYWSGAATVWADFRSLDPQASAPEGAVYVGDSSVVVDDTLHVWPCYWSLHQVPQASADGSRLSVPVTAVSSADDTTATEALEFCISNHPPEFLGARFVMPADRIRTEGDRTVLLVRNGDLIHLETTWRFSVPGFFVTGDFSAADDSFSAARVIYEPVEQPAADVQTHGIYYELDERAQTGDAARVPAQIIGSDGGCGRTTFPFVLEFDNRGPLTSPIFLDIPRSVTDPRFVIRGIAPAGSDSVLLVLNRTVEQVAPARVWADSLLFQDTLMLGGGSNQIVAYGLDKLGNRSPASVPAIVDLATAPQFKEWRVLKPTIANPDSAVWVKIADGARDIQVRSYWDIRADYNVFADFSALDDHFAPDSVRYSRGADIQVEHAGATETWACYEFEYRLSEANGTRDANQLVVPVTAYDPTTGYSTTTQSLQFCLSNSPPAHRKTWAAWQSPVFSVRDGDTLIVVRNGSQIRLHTSWFSRTRPFSVRADFSLLDTRTPFPVYAFVDSASTDEYGTYSIVYRLSEDACCGEGIDPYPLPVEIKVSDRGCGSASYVINFEFDNEGPELAAFLDRLPPTAVSASALPLSGWAPGAASALASIYHVDQDSTSQWVMPTDSLGAFWGEVSLLPGVNEITVFGRDPVGNRSPASPVYPILLSTQARMEIPKPFRPGDTILLEDPAGWSLVNIAIYNLEGDQIRVFEERGPLVRFDPSWDGRNGRGESVKSGPYLMRIRTVDSSGRTEEEVKAIVFQR